MSFPVGRRIRLVIGKTPVDSHIYDADTGEEIKGVMRVKLDVEGGRLPRFEIEQRIPPGSVVEGVVTNAELTADVGGGWGPEADE